MTTMARFAKVCAATFAVSLVSTVSAFATGCAINPTNSDHFRDPLPLQDEVALRVPGTGASAAGTPTTKSLTLNTAHIATEGDGTTTTAGTTTSNAQYYQLTRDLTDAVDFTSAVILGGVWAIVHSEPTSIESKKAVWGPGAANALEPAVYRFTVTEVGDSEFDYVLEGQPKAGGDWLSVMTGHGFGSSRPEHKQGWFQFNNDNYKTLEPARGHDEGTTKVTFDLRQLPATLNVELRPPAAEGWVDIDVTHEDGGAGQVAINGLGDIDPAKNTKLEDIQLLSRWKTDGSGRADIVMKNGDLPFTVNASECWSTSFARVYYKDTVNFEPASGDASACTFSDTAL